MHSLMITRFATVRQLLMMPGKKQIDDGKQQTIATFFKKEKRNANVEEKDLAKKFKSEEKYQPENFSPEQRKRIDQNKEKALKLLEEKACSGLDMGVSWREALKSELSKPYFQKLQEFVKSERSHTTIYPSERDVFSWTKFTSIEDTKVVIIGQDPYHGPNQAHGLCFSVQIGTPPPPSLVNIYKELEDDIKDFKKPSHGHLIGWANQGVLLLNACLTVVAKSPNSHKDKGWETFTTATIQWINSNLDNVVFILWGAYAQKKVDFVDKKRHLVLAGKHPSPLSAHRGFFGCKHFSKTNEYLKQQRKKEIDWCYLPESL